MGAVLGNCFSDMDIQEEHFLRTTCISDNFRNNFRWGHHGGAELHNITALNSFDNSTEAETPISQELQLVIGLLLSDHVILLTRSS